jgi:hypothetical protein
VSYRGRLTEAARDRLRAGGPELSSTAWMLTPTQIDAIVVDNVRVDVTSTTAYLILDCHVTPTDVESGDTVQFDVTLDQATALQILFASPLDETRLRVEPESGPPVTDVPIITGAGDHGERDER